ncbi:hypothetical protein EGW08_017818, partial [Elysia chlorotica]
PSNSTFPREINNGTVISDTREHFHRATSILIGDSFKRFEDEQTPNFSNQSITFSQVLCNNPQGLNSSSHTLNDSSQDLFINTEDARLDSFQTLNDSSQDLFINTEDVSLDISQTMNDSSKDLLNDTDARPNYSQTEKECTMNTHDFVRYILDCTPAAVEHATLPESVSTAGNVPMSAPSVPDHDVGEEDCPSEDDIGGGKDEEDRDPSYNPHGASNENSEGETDSSDSEDDCPITDAQPILPEYDTPIAPAISPDNRMQSTHPGRNTTRKRVRDEADWKTNIRKKQRNNGKEYVTRKGKQVREKSLKDTKCGCQSNCNGKISFQTRQEIFSK